METSHSRVHGAFAYWTSIYISRNLGMNSALTALVDFASLMFSSHQGTASMGILLTVGHAFTLICTLIILPALLRTPSAKVAS